MAGEAGKAEGMDRAERHADPVWKECATAAVQILAQRQSHVTSDEVAKLIREMWPDVHTHEPRALGAVMQNAARDGLIVKDGFDFHTSPSRHQAPCQVWRSLVVEPL